MTKHLSIILITLFLLVAVIANWDKKENKSIKSTDNYEYAAIPPVKLPPVPPPEK